MNSWPEKRLDYTVWLRTFPMLVNMGWPGRSPEIAGPSQSPRCLDEPLWSMRTHEIELVAMRHLTDQEIDKIFSEVSCVIDEDLLRFNPLVAYFGQFFQDGDHDRIEDERTVAHSVKRDLAWAAIEMAIGESGFFCDLLLWYDLGRWPYAWAGDYPAGHVLVV